MHQLFQLSFWLTRRRLRHSWGLTAATSLGILAAVVLLSATSLYSDLLAETGVRYALYSEQPSTLDVQVLSENRSLGDEDYRRLREVAGSAIDRHLGAIRTRVERFGRTQWGMPLATGPDQSPPPVTTVSGRPFFMTGFREHARLVEGHWPQEPGVAGPEGVELQSVMGQLAASELGVGVGSKLYITPFRSSPRERIVLTVVGLAVPMDPRDEFWLGYPSQFGRQLAGDMYVYPAYVSEEDFLGAIGTRFPTLIGDFGFNVFVDPSRITAQDVRSTRESLEALETDLNKPYPRTFTFTRLDRTLEEFERDLTLARVPVYVFISLVVVIVLYFLILIAGILGRSQADELGLLRSRGGSIAQACGVLLLADGALAAASVAVGPLIAWVIVRYAMLPAFRIESLGVESLGVESLGVGGGPINIGVTGEMFWMGAIGAVLALAALTFAAATRARSGVSDSLAGRSRPPAVSFMQRYYLDIVAIVVVGVVWWQFGEREGFLTRSLGEQGLQTDPTVILGPVLGLLAAALVMLRVLPLAVRLVVWLCLRAGPAWSSFATARMARDPVLPSALAVLLMLSAALGVFGATFQSSMSSSQRDQALYRVGGDVVLSGPGVERARIEELRQIPGVSSATMVLHDTISLTTGQFSFPARLLAAEPRALAEAAWFRDDFSDATLPQLAELIRNPPVEDAGVQLPTSGCHSAAGLSACWDRIGIWLNTAFLEGAELEANINVWARLRNTDGIYNNISMGGFSSAGEEGNDYWRFFSGELSERMARDEGGWTVTAIFLTTSTVARVPSGAIRIDDLTVFGPALDPEGVVVEGFDDPSASGLNDGRARWRQIDILGGVQDVVEWGPSSGRSSGCHTASGCQPGGGLTFSWQEPFTGEQRGIQIPPVNLPIPAIGGGGLRQGDRLWVKQVLASIPIQIVGETALFPTTAKPHQPFVILDIESFLTYRKFLPSVGPVDSPGQIWLSLDPTLDAPAEGGRERDRDNVVAHIEDGAPPLTRVINRDAVASRAALNPLAGGGWDGLTGLGIAAVVAAVGIASLLYGAAAARATRVDNAVARALGLSSWQLLLTLLAERWLMAGAAIVAGAAIGYWPGLQLLQRLQATPSGSGSADAGTALLPPMIPQVHELLLGLVLAGLLLSVMGSAFYSAVLARRDRPAEVLRTSFD